MNTAIKIVSILILSTCEPTDNGRTRVIAPLAGITVTSEAYGPHQDCFGAPRSIDHFCTLSDEGEGEGEGEPEFADHGVGIGRTTRYLRHLVPIGTSVLIILWGLPNIRTKRRTRALTWALAVCAHLAVLNYAVFSGRPRSDYVNDWEFFHYYLGSKYAPEIGYTGLYNAALVADDETGRKFRHQIDAIRNLCNDGCIRVDAVLAGREAIVSRFSRHRWEAFRNDVTHFKRKLSQRQWNHIFHDKGYNATPVWGMIAGRFASWISTDQPSGLLGLSLLDPILLFCAIIAVWRCFDLRTALLVAVLIGTHMAMSHTHFKGAFLRTDWVASLVLAICAVKARRPSLGGAFAAYAVTSRVFPILFTIPFFIRFSISWIRGEPRRSDDLRFLSGFVVALLVLVCLVFVDFGPGYLQSFVDKIWRHHDSFSPWRVGFKHLFLGAYEYRPTGSATHQEIFHEWSTVWWGIQLLILAIVTFIMQPLKNWERIAIGFVPTFFAVAPTYYYYIMLIIPLLFFCGRMNQVEGKIGIVWLLLSSSIAYIVEDAVGRALLLFYVLALMILGVCMLMGIGAWLELVRHRIGTNVPSRPARTWI